MYFCDEHNIKYYVGIFNFQYPNFYISELDADVLGRTIEILL